MTFALSVIASLLIAQTSAADTLQLSQVFQFKSQSGFGQSEVDFEPSLHLDLKKFSVYPGANILSESLMQNPSASFEIWAEDEGGNLNRLKGNSKQIIDQLRYQSFENDLNALEAYADRLIFFRMQKKFQPGQVRAVFEGAKGLAIGVGALYLIRRASLAKKLVTAVSWAGRGIRGAQQVATVAALAPTPEKATIVGWVIELGAVVVLEIVTTALIDRTQLHMERGLVVDGLLQDIKAFEAGTQTPDSPIAENSADLLVARILRQFEDLELMMNVDSSKKIKAAEDAVGEIIAKLQEKRKADNKILADTFYFMRPYQSTTTYRRTVNRVRDEWEIKTRQYETEEVSESTPAAKLDDAFNSFLIRNSYPRLREFQKIRNSMHLKSETELSDSEIRLRARAEKNLKDAYYLSLFRDEFDTAISSATWELTTPLKDKYSYGIYHLGVRRSLEENLRNRAGATRLLDRPLREAFGQYIQLISTKEVSKNPFDLMIAQLGFIRRVMKLENFKDSQELIILEQKLTERLEKAQNKDFGFVADSLIHSLMQRWVDAYLTQGVGIPLERALVLKGLLEENPDSLTEWNEADLLSLVR